FHSRRQPDRPKQGWAFPGKVKGYVAEPVRHPPGDTCERAWLWTDDDGFKAEVGWPNPRDGREEVIDWMGRPGMAIRTAGLGHLEGGTEAVSLEGLPQVQSLEQGINLANLPKRLKQVVGEVDGCLVQALGREHLPDQLASVGPADHPGEHGQALGMLAEV